jgi:hypothetical protein
MTIEGRCKVFRPARRHSPFTSIAMDVVDGQTEERNMKIVVIGGSGLIGTKLVNRLRQQGHNVIAASPASGVTPSRVRDWPKRFQVLRLSSTWRTRRRSRTRRLVGLRHRAVPDVQHRQALWRLILKEYCPRSA